jgi:hypothetical protein
LGLGYGLFISGDGELGKAVSAAGFLGAQVGDGVEAFDLGGDLSLEACGVEGLDAVNAGASGLEGFPGGGSVEPLGTDDAYACNKNSGSQLRASKHPCRR